MRSLSNLDASFLHLETPHTPMHMVGIFIFRNTSDTPMTAERFRQHVTARLPEARIFRERLASLPGGQGQLFWAEDPHFDLDNHLHISHLHTSDLHTDALDGPFDQALLQPLANRFFTPLLNRDHPLWEILFVSERNALPSLPSHFAVILKVHHAACDGLSAKAIIEGLFDGPTPQTRNGDTTWQPAPLPSSYTLLFANMRAAIAAPKRTLKLARQLGTSVKNSLALRRRHLLEQPLFFSSPSTPFNIGIDDQRVRLSVELSLPLLKMIRRTQPNLTVNDVVLTVCGGAMRRYLASLGKNPQRPIIALAPVSKRDDGTLADAGNKVSAMLVGLGTDLNDPLERLQQVRENATRAKRYNLKVAIEKLFDYLPILPTGLFLRAYTQSKLADVTPPVFNVVITNIAALPPGLNLNGAALESAATFAPVFDGVGLSLVILSHQDCTTIGITSTPDALTHPALFATCLRQALEELALATGVIVQETKQNSVQPWKAPGNTHGKVRSKRVLEDNLQAGG